jgi:hypothetical protein
MKVVTVRKIEDKGYYTASTLSNGYLSVDGKKIKVRHEEKFMVNDISSIKSIETSSAIIGYIDIVSGKKLSVGEYETKKKNLLKNAVYQYADYNGEYDFNNVQDEIEYITFIKTHDAVKKEVINEVDVEVIELAPIIINTGNNFIEPILNCEDESGIFKLNIKDASTAIVKNKFKELGFDFVQGLNYGETADKKIWSNSNHSHIRYVVAFGHFIFDDDVKKYNRSDTTFSTLDNCRKKFNEMKEDLERKIEFAYALNFKSIDKNKIDVQKFFNLLNKTNKFLNDIQPKKATYSEYRICKQNLNELMQEFKNTIIENGE